jgi:hypothetical protein
MRDLLFVQEVAYREVPVTFKNCQDLDAFRGNSIDNTITSFQHFSYCIRSQFRDHAPGVRERRYAVTAFDQFGHEVGGSLGGVLRDKIFDFLKAFKRLFRPDNAPRYWRATLVRRFHNAFLASLRVDMRRWISALSITRSDSASAKPLATDTRNRSFSWSRSNSTGDNRTPAGLPFCVMTMGCPESRRRSSQEAACDLKAPRATTSSASWMIFISSSTLSIDQIKYRFKTFFSHFLGLFSRAILRSFWQRLGIGVFFIFLSSAPLPAATFYIDFAFGADNNVGASKTAPWKHSPGMPGCTSNCLGHAPAPGDRFIFKGGVTWPSSSLG